LFFWVEIRFFKRGDLHEFFDNTFSPLKVNEGDKAAVPAQ